MAFLWLSGWSAVGVSNVNEARRLMDNLHPMLVRALISLVACDATCSSELSEYISTSPRNSRRIISVLERLRIVKTVSYGRKKLVLSVNEHVEREIRRGIALLVPYVVDRLRLPYSEVGSNVDTVARELLESLGIHATPCSKLFSVVKWAVDKGLGKRALPAWLRRTLTPHYRLFIGIARETAKQPPLCFSFCHNYDKDEFVDVGDEVFY